MSRQVTFFRPRLRGCEGANDGVSYSFTENSVRTLSELSKDFFTEVDVMSTLGAAMTKPTATHRAGDPKDGAILTVAVCQNKGGPPAFTRAGR